MKTDMEYDQRLSNYLDFHVNCDIVGLVHELKEKRNRLANVLHVLRGVVFQDQLKK